MSYYPYNYKSIGKKLCNLPNNGNILSKLH